MVQPNYQDKDRTDVSMSINCKLCLASTYQELHGLIRTIPVYICTAVCCFYARIIYHAK